MNWFSRFKHRCYCPSWEWPLMWRSTAVKRQQEAVRHERQRVDKDLVEERAKLQKLIPKIVQVGHRRFGDDGTYQIMTTLDGRYFRDVYDSREREYFAEYVGREVEANVARLIVAR